MGTAEETPVTYTGDSLWLSCSWTKLGGSMWQKKSVLEGVTFQSDLQRPGRKRRTNRQLESRDHLTETADEFASGFAADFLDEW